MILPPGAELVGVTAITGLIAAWGKHRFISKSDCEKIQGRCSGEICRKIDDLKSDLKESREVQGKVFDKLDDVTHFMGRVDQYMRDHNNGGDKS